MPTALGNLPTRKVRVRVPAKINLHLSVGPRRADGFHEVVTVFQAIDLYDEISATEADHLRVQCNGPESAGVPADEHNLAWRAAELLAAEHEIAPHAALHITKNIPMAGGLAGGSADAAAALVALVELWGLGERRADLTELAARLGSDVAFALTGGTALGTGRGEQLTPALAVGRFHWVLAFADFGLSTSQVYAELDRLREAGTAAAAIGAPASLLDALRAGNAERLADELANDLEPVALSLAPALRRTLRAGLELGALAAIVSGSGPTCAFLCADAEQATGLAAALPAEDVCRTTRAVSGPVHGARVVG